MKKIEGKKKEQKNKKDSLKVCACLFDYEFTYFT